MRVERDLPRPRPQMRAGWACHGDFMTDLTAFLTEYLRRFDNAADADVAAEQIGSSMNCSFEVYLTESGTDGPEVTAYAEILPGGEIAEAHLEARQDGEVATCDIEPGTGLHRALQDAITDMWTGWDDRSAHPPLPPS